MEDVTSPWPVAFVESYNWQRIIVLCPYCGCKEVHQIGNVTEPETMDYVTFRRTIGSFRLARCEDIFDIPYSLGFPDDEFTKDIAVGWKIIRDGIGSSIQSVYRGYSEVMNTEHKDWTTGDNEASSRRMTSFTRCLRQAVATSVRSPPGSISASCLFNAAMSGDCASISLSIVNNVDINATDGFGWTALMHAAFHGEASAAAMLLYYGCQKDVLGMDRRSALQLARETQMCDDNLISFAKANGRTAKLYRGRQLIRMLLGGAPVHTVRREILSNTLVVLAQESFKSCFASVRPYQEMRGFLKVVAPIIDENIVSLLKDKTVGVLFRESPHHLLCAISGWKRREHRPSHLIDAAETTSQVLDLCRFWGFPLCPNAMDAGILGQVCASHVEKQLIVAFGTRHDCIMMGTQGDGYIKALRPLMPRNRVRTATILLDNQACQNCEDFKTFAEREWNVKFKFEVMKRHHRQSNGEIVQIIKHINRKAAASTRRRSGAARITATEVTISPPYSATIRANAGRLGSFSTMQGRCDSPPSTPQPSQSRAQLRHNLLTPATSVASHSDYATRSLSSLSRSLGLRKKKNMRTIRHDLNRDVAQTDKEGFQFLVPRGRANNSKYTLTTTRTEIPESDVEDALQSSSYLSTPVSTRSQRRKGTIPDSPSIQRLARRGHLTQRTVQQKPPNTIDLIDLTSDENDDHLVMVLSD